MYSQQIYIYVNVYEEDKLRKCAPMKTMENEYEN